MMNEDHNQLGLIANDIDVHQNASGVVNVINFNRSKGNYAVDADGNVMLDVASTELNPLGYNHDSFKTLMHGSGSDCSIINGAAGDQIASARYADKVENAMGAVAPSGLRGITLTSSSNSSQDAVHHSIVMRGAAEDSHHMHTLSFEGSSHSNFGFNDSLTHQVPYP